MITGKVIGEIHSTINHAFYDGKKMLIVEKIGFDGQSSDDYLIAIDGGVGAGVGDKVLVLDEGTGARQVVSDKTAPLRSIIVGVIDTLSIG